MSAPIPEQDGHAELWRRAYGIFDLAMERPAGDREVFARQSAAGDRPEVLPLVLELIRNAAEEPFEEKLQPRIGSQIGRYVIVERLGRGAMGQVYAARDLELGRIVALKFLTGATAAGRLIREARAASALNHPNIVTVHDLVRQGDDTALAMELVEGRSLREYCGTPQPIADVVHHGRQIAQALAATHARGVAHRDMKPENVIVRRDGYVKVLDFGLARRERLPGSVSGSGLFSLLGGTLSYMSPEQTRGERGTAASDIFSLGTVLYELLCGVRPFQSDSPVETAYAIAHHDIKEPQSLRPEIGAPLNSLICDMMAKDPAIRPRAQEVEYRLAALQSTGSGSRGMAHRFRFRTGSARRLRTGLLAGGGVLAAAALLLYLAVSWPNGAHPVPVQSGVIRYTIPMPEGIYASAVAISPKGDQIAYMAGGERGNHIYRRYLDSNFSRIVPGSEHAEEPFFSPDGDQIAFFVQKGIRIAGASGYRDIALDMVPFREHGDWTADGWIYFDALKNKVSEIWRVRAQGGTPQHVLSSVPSEHGLAERKCREALPDGLLFSVMVTTAECSIAWLDWRNPAPRTLIDHAMGGRILPTGHLLYYWNNELMAAPFDLRRRKVTGSPVDMVGGVRISTLGTAANAAVSDNGTLVYLRAPDLPKRKLYWLTLHGPEVPLDLPAAAYEQAEISPDGKTIAFVQQTEHGHWLLALYAPQATTTRTLFQGKSPYMRAIWSPDSKQLAVSLIPEGQGFSNLFLIPATGPESPAAEPEKPTPLTHQPLYHQFPLSWSGPANAILFTEGEHPSTEFDTYLLPMGTRKPKPMVVLPGTDRGPSFSPDGRWFVYATDFEDSVFLQDVAQTQPPRRVSRHGGRNTLWSPRGDRIYYLKGGSSLMEVTVDKQGNTSEPREVKVTSLPAFPDATSRGFSIAPDGRFLMIHDLPNQHPPGTEIDVVVNWFTELKRLVPAA
jgi:Tol biopolymer transport system component